MAKDARRGYVLLSGRNVLGQPFTVLALWDKDGANSDEARDALEGVFSGTVQSERV